MTNKLNLSLFIPLWEIKKTDKELTDTNPHFYYLIKEKTSIHIYNRGDLLQTNRGFLYCVYGKEAIVPTDYENIIVSIMWNNMENYETDIHIQRKGDYLIEEIGTVASPLEESFEWYDIGEFYVSMYENEEFKMFREEDL